MAAYQDLTSSKIKDLVQIEFENPATRIKKSTKGLGCSNCPQNNNPLVTKIKGLKRIKGKKIFAWFQNPGRQENSQGLELVGPAGKLIWEEFAKLGISREDVDIQNVVRCQNPVEDEDTGYVKDEPPTKEMIKCCSIYNETALDRNGGKAKVHLVFGQIAAKSLLGREYRKDTPIFWSKRLNAKVVCLDHPAYFLHGAPKHRLDQFRQRLQVAFSFTKTSGKYSILENNDYKPLIKANKVKLFFRRLKRYAIKHKTAVVVDIETGYLYKNWSSAKLREKEVYADTPGVKKVMLGVGFCVKAGKSRTVVMDHPDAFSKSTPENRKLVKKLTRQFLSDPEVEKVMHYGSSDTTELLELLNTEVEGYWFDTNYSTYLLWPQLKKYGLDNLTKEKLPEFSGYKDIVKDYMVKGKHNLAAVPLKVMVKYNGGDCDVTKRLENLTRKPLLDRSKYSKPLLKTYRHVAFTLRDMQECGPLYDVRYSRRLLRCVKKKLKRKLRRLRKLSGMKTLNPRSQPQIKEAIYEKIGLPIITVKRKEGRTDENTLKVLQVKTKHPFIEELFDYRQLSVMKNTQLTGYEESYSIWGRLRTIWWLTGAITGRLRSGGKDEEGIVNLQNIPKAPVMKNLLISDKMWRCLEEWFELKQYDKILECKVFEVADYSAIELRVIAELAEPKFIKIFNSGKDIHGKMGSGFTDWTYKQICTDEEIRTKVKNINFGLPFGMGKQSFYEGLIARGTKISRKESDELYDAYFAEYDGVARFQVESQDIAERTGYAPTLFGFFRPIIQGDDVRSTFWGNQAINSRVQGTAHQYLLFAMALLRTHKHHFKFLKELCMEVHDALAFFSKVKFMQKAYKQLRELLVDAVPEYIKKHFGYTLKVPLECEVKAGFRMGTMLKYKGEDPIEFVGKWIAANKESNKKIKKEWGIAA